MRTVILAIVLTAFSGLAAAEGGWRLAAVDFGTSTSKSVRGHTEFDIYRLGLQREFQRVFFENSRVTLGGYFEASVNYWDADDEDVYAVAFSPVFALYWTGGNLRFRPYLELGIGAALISDTAFAGRELSTTFQFEDRLGIGIRSPRFDLHYRFMHYSNGGIDKPNNGFDAHVIGLAFGF